MAVPQWSRQQILEQLDAGQRWPAPSITYAFPLTPAAMASQGEAAGFRALGAQEQQAVGLALQAWDDLIPQDFVPKASGPTDLEFAATSAGSGGARAFGPPQGSVWLSAGDGNLASAWPGDGAYFPVLQQIGRALGLDRMGGAGGDARFVPSSRQDSQVLSVMSDFGPRGAAMAFSGEVFEGDWTDASGRTGAPQTPMPSDVLAIQAIYGASTTTRSDATVYGFNSTVSGAIGAIFDFARNPQPILTIFDSGGLDTLDLSGWSTPSRIDLRPGSFSSGGGMRQNIAIAEGTWVESASGGAGDDVIVGNDLSNWLRGRDGDDEIFGGAGDDRLDGGSGNDRLDGGPGIDTAQLLLTQADFVITPTASGATLASALGTVVTTSIELFEFADGIRTLFELVQPDRQAPRLLSVSPADDATGVAADAPFVLRFDEAVKPGSGVISLFDASGTLLRSVPTSDAALRFEGSTVTWALAPARTAGAYSVMVSPGAVVDLAGNAFAGIAGSTAWNFGVAARDTSPPQPIAFFPPDDASGVSPGSTLVVRFNEPVRAGGGSVVVRDGSGAPVAAVALGETRIVTIEGNEVRIAFNAGLPPLDDVSVSFEADSLLDSAGNAFAGWSSRTTWNFRTSGAAPADDFGSDEATSGRLQPAGTAQGVIETPGDTDGFRIALAAGQGVVFTLLRAPDGLADPRLSVYGPGQVLLAADDEGAGGGNARLSFVAPTSGDYVVRAADFGPGIGAYTLLAAPQDGTAPQLRSVTPADDAQAVPLDADLVLVFDEAVRPGNGSLRLIDDRGLVLREVAAGDSKQVHVAGSTVTVDFAGLLLPATPWRVQVDEGAFRDLAGNAFAGVAGGTAWNFATTAATPPDDFPMSSATTDRVVPGGVAVSGQIEAVDDSDLLKADLRAGITYRIDMTRPEGSSVDPFLALYGPLPAAEAIARVDDGGPQPQDARLFFTPSASGTYLLAARSSDEGRGSYRVQVSVPGDDQPAAAATSGRLAVGGSVAGSIGVPTDGDWFAVALQAGQPYAFDLRSATGGLEDPYLVLFGSDGRALAWDDDSGGAFNARIAFRPSAGGTYYVAASDFGSGTGDYTLSALLRNAVSGGSGADTLRGTVAADLIEGGAGDDALTGGAGDDGLDGGAGIDTAVYAGRTALFDWQPLAGTWLLQDASGAEGIDNLVGIERLRFADRRIALDLDGHAGTTVKILGAVFGATYVSQPEYVGIGLQLLDGGMAEPTLWRLALDARLGAGAGDAAVVELLWTNLLGSPPSAAERAVFVDAIAAGTFTQASLAQAAGETSFNLVNIGFEELQLVGVPFTG